jgi:hypothetical protein
MTSVFEPPPLQNAITAAAIQGMLTLRPRRMQLATEWKTPLHPPRGEHTSWTLLLPFCETLANAFAVMCDVPGSGLAPVKDQRCHAFLDDAASNPASLDEVRAWMDAVGPYVAIRDCLSMSFALDYDKERGDPAKPVTRIGALRGRAKPYDKAPTADTLEAAQALVDECLAFLGRVTAYESATAVVAMPPSRPDKPFDLPSYLAAGIAVRWERTDASRAVSTIKARPPLKNVALADKLKALDGTIQVSRKEIKGQIVLLVDDLYQSGVTMNYVAMQLLCGGASKVFGLACEKTCRNDDNLSWRR